MGMGINNQLSVNQHINEISASEDFSITKAAMMLSKWCAACHVSCVRVSAVYGSITHTLPQ